VKTFKCILQQLQAIHFPIFVLENVDLEDDKGSNLDLILEALREPGYQVKAYMMISSDYGLPQRRVRLYFIGIHRDDFPNFRFDKVLEYLQLFRLRCQSPVLWFNDHCQTEQI